MAPHPKHHDWSPNALNDFVSHFCGDLIGEGCPRRVFEHKQDPTLVIKIEMFLSTSWFQNAGEWAVWKEVEDFKEMSRWLAPCISISASGLVLVQRRVEKLRDDEYPPKIPKWVSADQKKENWGRLNGKPVCHDYSRMSWTAKTKATVKAVW